MRKNNAHVAALLVPVGTWCVLRATMGGKNSTPASYIAAENGDGKATLRAIARGKVYVVITYPQEVEQMEDSQFHEACYDALLADLQKALPDFEIILDCGPIQRYSKHAMFFNSSHPEKEHFRPRVRVEVFYTGEWHSVDPKLVKRLVTQNLDPQEATLIDVRCEMGRYHTTSHLETLLRL